MNRPLHDYINLLIKWNKTYNLTGITDPQQIMTRHILDSLSILPYLSGTRILDVGSGAGLPGIPLAISAPERHFVLLDSNGKKTRFLTQAKQTLSLDNIEIVNERVENFHPMQGFDTIVSRAFSAIPELLKLAGHLCAPGGKFLMMKGIHPATEMENLPKEFHVKNVHKLTVPGMKEERSLVIVEHG